MIHVAAAVIIEKGKLLICQRPKGKNCALLWEFPGGKIEEGETPENCLKRECREELDIAISVKRFLREITHDYGDFSVCIRFYLAGIEGGNLCRREHSRIQWIEKSELSDFSFCPADDAVLRDIEKMDFFAP